MNFHDGCTDCTQSLDICIGCQYFETNWNLPDLNPVHIKEEKRKDRDRKKVREAVKERIKIMRGGKRKD